MDRMVFDLVDPAELTIASRLMPLPKRTLARFLPNRLRNSIDYKFTKQDRSRRRAASYRAWDSPAVVRKRPGLAVIRGSLPPTSVIIPLEEEDHQRLNAARAAGTSDIVSNIFNSDALAASRAVADRIELARGQALCHFKVEIGTEAEPENDLQLAVDFAAPAAHYIISPQLFSDPASDILGLLEAWIATYEDTSNGARPGVMVGSRTIRANMLKNDAIRQLAGNLNGVPDAVTPEQLNRILESRELPPFELHDEKVLDHAGVLRRVVDADRLLLLPAPVDPNGQGDDTQVAGITQFGRTLEADKLVTRQALDDASAPGLVVAVLESENPIAFGTLAAAIALPTVANPELVFSVKVL